MRSISGLKKPLGLRSPAKPLTSPMYKLDLGRRRNAEGCFNTFFQPAANRAGAQLLPPKCHLHLAVSGRRFATPSPVQSWRQSSKPCWLIAGMPLAAPAASAPWLSEDSGTSRLVQKMQRSLFPGRGERHR